MPIGVLEYFGTNSSWIASAIRFSSSGPWERMNSFVGLLVEFCAESEPNFAKFAERHIAVGVRGSLSGSAVSAAFRFFSGVCSERATSFIRNALASSGFIRPRFSIGSRNAREIRSNRSAS